MTGGENHERTSRLCIHADDQGTGPDLGLSAFPIAIPIQRLKPEDYRIWSKTWLLAGVLRRRATGRLFRLRKSPRVDSGHTSRRWSRQSFHNVCQHRGNQLKQSGCGHSPYLSCGFHGWEYHLNGCIKAIPEAHDFPQGVPADKLNLKELKCDVGRIHLGINGPRYRAQSTTSASCRSTKGPRA